MAYNRAAHVKELDSQLSELLHQIELDEKEIRRVQDRLREYIQIFRAKMSEREALENAEA